MDEREDPARDPEPHGPHRGTLANERGKLALRGAMRGLVNGELAAELVLARAAAEIIAGRGLRDRTFAARAIAVDHTTPQAWTVPNAQRCRADRTRKWIEQLLAAQCVDDLCARGKLSVESGDVG
jgi:hypothetical protein